MICVICRHAEPQGGTTTVTLERDGATIVMKRVPALVCPNCGEAYLSEEVSRHLLDIAGDAARQGVTLDVREYAAA